MAVGISNQPDKVHAPVKEKDHLSSRGFTDIEEFATKGEHAIIVPADNTEAADGQSLGRVSLCQYESALLRATSTSIVGIIKLGDACVSHLHLVLYPQPNKCINMLITAQFLPQLHL